MGNDIVVTFAAAIAAALALGYAVHRMGISPLVGFLLAGVAVGPPTPGFTANLQVAEQFAEMGIIVLMFDVGLKFHLHELMAVWRVSVPGALLTSLLTAIMAWVGLTAIGIDSNEALVAGLAISIASTVVLMRVLAENRDLSTRAGHIAMGWVVIEDLLPILLLVALPVLAENGTGELVRLGIPLLLAALKIAACAANAIFLGGRLIPWMLGKVDATESRELFTLAPLALAPGMALLAAKFFGVSMALGAFLAGLVVGRSDSIPHGRQPRPYLSVTLLRYSSSSPLDYSSIQPTSSPTLVNLQMRGPTRPCFVPMFRRPLLRMCPKSSGCRRS